MFVSRSRHVTVFLATFHRASSSTQRCSAAEKRVSSAIVCLRPVLFAIRVRFLSSFLLFSRVLCMFFVFSEKKRHIMLNTFIDLMINILVHFWRFFGLLR